MLRTAWLTGDRLRPFILAALPVAIIVGSQASWSALAWLLIGGVASGLLSGMLGIGGALITVPVLYLTLPTLGVPGASLPHVVVSSALAAMLPTTLMSAWSHHRAGTLDLSWLLRLAPGMALGALIGAVMATQLRGIALTLAFAAQSLYYGCRQIARGRAGGAWAPSTAAVALLRLPSWSVAPAMAAFCACVGMGGGSLVNPYLQSQGLDLRRAVATGSTLNLCIALGGCVAFCMSACTIACFSRAADAAGSTWPCWPAALLIGSVAMLFAPHGVALARRMTTGRLAYGIGTVNVVAAVVLLAETLR